MPTSDRDIHNEILGGLGQGSGRDHQQARVDNALNNANFYRGIFPDDANDRRGTDNWDGTRFQRNSRIMGWLVSTLAANLYGHGPTRSLTDHPEASTWLNAIYKATATDALLQSADQWATVSDVAAVQAIATEDPSRPVRHLLWPAHQLYVWDSLDEPLTPRAVGVLDRWDNMRRLRLWTPETLTTYATEKIGPVQTSGGTAYRLIGQVDNPFGLIPFAFVHYHYPTTEFFSGGPGDAFRELNDYINYALTEVGDSLRYCAKPIVKLRRTKAGWKPTLPVRPGAIWNLPAEVDADGLAGDPDADYLQCDLGFVGAHWDDIEGYLDHSMQCADVPPAAFRLTQSSAKSGLAIVGERLPLIERAEARRRPAGYYERDLARVTMAVGGKHLGRNAGLIGDDTMRVSAARLDEAAKNPDLTLRWPSMQPKLSGQEANTEDAFRLENGLKSRTQILIERDDMTRDEAEAYIEQTSDDLAREARLLAAAVPAPLSATKPPADEPDDDPTEPDDDTEPKPEPKPTKAA